MYSTHETQQQGAVSGRRQPSGAIAQSTDGLIDGRFLVQDVIVETRNSTVHRGIDLATNQPAAVKLLRADLPRPLVASMIRAARELKRHAEDLHPGTVRIIEIAEWKGQTAIISLLVEGMTLQQFVAQRDRKAMDIPEALRVVAVVAEVVLSAMKYDIIHGDLSPHNILIDPVTFDVFVTDFGGVSADYGKGSVAQSGSLRSTGGWAITPDFCALEVRRGRSPDERSEVYSLGAILYWALVGEPPSGYADQWEFLEKQPENIRQLIRGTLCHASNRYDLTEFAATARTAIEGHAVDAARRALPIVVTRSGSESELPLNFLSSRGQIEFRFVTGGRFRIGQDDPAVPENEFPAHEVSIADFYVSKVLNEQQVRHVLDDNGHGYPRFKANEPAIATVEYGMTGHILSALKPGHLISELEFECLASRGELARADVQQGIWTRDAYHFDWHYGLCHRGKRRQSNRALDDSGAKTVRGLARDGEPSSWITSRTPVRTTSSLAYGMILVIPAHPAYLYVQQVLEETADE